MDVQAVRQALRRFALRHRQTFDYLGGRQSQILELGALIGTAQHFASAGFFLGFHNPGGGRRFRVKTGTRGHPSDYSRIIVSRDSERYEIHSNLVARGFYDDGSYCVDVGIVTPGAIPLQRPTVSWAPIRNIDLVSFVEAKRLVIYPMLLAQFLGVVHEIRPEFVSSRPRVIFGRKGVLPPAMVALGGFSANANMIYQTYGVRGCSFLVVPWFDFQLSRCRRDPAQSPFYDAGGIP